MSYSKEVLGKLNEKYSNEPEFLQAATEVIDSVSEIVDKNKTYIKQNILERITIPDRIISFKVPWEDDKGDINVNTGYRVQFNNTIGPYKGGLRFHPTVNQSVLKFLGFEQIFKNALTGLPLGGGKGGSDFDPKEKSDSEIMRFTYSFMDELYKYIGENIDIPAGDIGVGGREIGYLFGRYKKLTNSFEGVLTGKGLNWGGSLIRTEATGFGLVYFLLEMLNAKNDTLKDKRVLISGSGNVATYAALKVIDEGGKVLTMSDSNGTILNENGYTKEQIEQLIKHKEERSARVSEFAEIHKDIEYHENENPWNLTNAEIALPCATQNEISEDDAKKLANNGIKFIAEGANMPSTNEAIEVYKEKRIIFAPGKASNAGGVATSGLEMSQNSLRLSWSREDVDSRLKEIMKTIHENIVSIDPNDYVKGANIFAFRKVADSMIAQGLY